jgi:hypothetical protein
MCRGSSSGSVSGGRWCAHACMVMRAHAAAWCPRLGLILERRSIRRLEAPMRQPHLLKQRVVLHLRRVRRAGVHRSRAPPPCTPPSIARSIAPCTRHTAPLPPPADAEAAPRWWNSSWTPRPQLRHDCLHDRAPPCWCCIHLLLPDPPLEVAAAQGECCRRASRHILRACLEEGEPELMSPPPPAS